MPRSFERVVVGVGGYRDEDQQSETYTSVDQQNEFTNSNNTADRELENLLRAANVINRPEITDAQMQLAVTCVAMFSRFF